MTPTLAAPATNTQPDDDGMPMRADPYGDCETPGAVDYDYEYEEDEATLGSDRDRVDPRL